MEGENGIDVKEKIPGKKKKSKIDVFQFSILMLMLMMFERWLQRERKIVYDAHVCVGED